MTHDPHPPSRTPVQHLARFIGHGLWALIPVLSLGFLAWVPATQTWWKQRTAGWAMTAVLLAIGAVAIGVGMAMDVENSAPLGLVLIGSGVGGTAAALIGRKYVFADPEPERVDPAVADVLEDRRRRDEARRIVATDPAMAVELAIGRPDLARSYDDGGLVDLNNAGAAVIANMLGWPASKAESFVADRDRREGYESLSEIAAMSTIAPRTLDRIADHIVLLPYGTAARSTRRAVDPGPGA